MVYPHLNYGQGAALLTLLLLNNHQDILESRETLLILAQYLYLKTSQTIRWSNLIHTIHPYPKVTILA